MLANLKARLSGFPPRYRVATTALLVAVGYYAGANVGIILRFPAAVPSVVWPPNSILTATLLLAPRKRWWIYLLAALPAHLAAELPAFPPGLVLALFATNCSEAVLAALFVRSFSDEPGRLDTLRRVVIYVVGAALVAPYLSSFLDAAAVATLRGEPYWHVFRVRFSSNVLSGLTIAPAILTFVGLCRDSVAAAPLRKRTEAALLAASVVTTAIMLFATDAVGGAARAISARSPGAWLLPFLLWAAVRFGPPGATFSTLATTLIAVWGAMHSLGPFSGVDVGQFVPPLQIFLTVLAIPLLCLAALIEERRKAENTLAERLRFEEFLGGLSAGFVHVSSAEIEGAVAGSLRNVGEFFGSDRV